MSITKDGFHKHIPSDGINIGNDNYVLLAGGGYIQLGNNVNQVPISNTTLSTGLNADMLDGVHADELLTYFSSNGISSNENTLTLLNTYLTIGGSTYYTDIKTAPIINSLSISRLSSDATTNLTVGITVNGVASSDKTLTDLYAKYATQLLNARNITIGLTTRSFNGTANISWALADILGTSDIGSTTKPIYYNGTNFIALNYSISSNVNSGTANRMAWYSAATTIATATTIYASNTQLTINGTSAPANSGNFQVIGTSTMRHIYPEATNTYDLGSNTLRWKNILIKGHLNIIMDADTSNAKNVFTISNTSNAQIAELMYHNTGDTNGAFILTPYAHSGTNAWEGAIGLYIGKNNLKWENKYILRYSANAVSNKIVISDGTIGNVKTSSETLGDTNKPIWLNGGTLNALSATKGSTTKGVYLASGAISEMSYSLNANIESGTANRIAWYKENTKIGSGTITTDGAYLGNVSYLSINTAHQTGYRLYINGNARYEDSIYIQTGDNDKFIQFCYNINNYAGASWRLISRGSGSSDTNYFDIETGGSSSSANTWYRVIRCTMDNRYVGIGTDSPSYKLDVNGVTRSTNFISSVATGTQPYACTSTTLNTNLNADLLDGVHASGLFTAFSGGAISSSGNTLTQTNHSITIGSTTKTAGSSTATIINSLSVSTLSSNNTTNLTAAITINGKASTNNTITDLIARQLAQTSISNLSTFINASNLIYAAAGGSNSVGDKPSGVDAFGVFSYKTADGWYGQLLTSSNTSTGLYWRTASSSLSGGWKKLLDSTNYTDYTVTKTGGGASGTWNINVSGSAYTLSSWAESSGSEDRYVWHSWSTNDARLAYNSGLMFNPNNKLLKVSSTSGFTYIGDGYIQIRKNTAANPTANYASIEFSYSGGQEVYLGYTPNDSYRTSKGLKVWGSSSDNSNCWFEVEGEMYAKGGYRVLHEGNLNYSTSGKNYKISKDSSNNLYVNVPWTDQYVNQSQTDTTNWRGIVLGYNSSGTANSGIDGTVTNIVYTTNRIVAQSHTGAIIALGRGTFAGLTSSSGDLIFNNTNHIVWNSGSWWQRIYVTDDSSDNTSVFTFQQSENTSGSSWKNLFNIRDNGVLDVYGTIYREYSSNSTPFIWINGNDYDNWIWTISSGTSTNKYYGFGLKYLGSGSGNDNKLVLYADNQNGTDIAAYSIQQDGVITFGQALRAPGFKHTSYLDNSYLLQANGGAKAESSLSVGSAWSVSSFTQASSWDGGRYIWMSYTSNDGQAAYWPNFYYNTYRQICYSPNFQGHLIGSAERLSQSSISSLSSFTHGSDFIYAARGGGNGLDDKPSRVDAFGVFSYKTADGWYGQLLTSSNMASGLYWRTASSSLSGGWKRVLDSASHAIYADGYMPKMGPFTTTGYYYIPSVGTAITRTNGDSGWRKGCIPVKSGDVFYIKGRGGYDPDLYAFTDMDCIVRSISGDGVAWEGSYHEITAGQDGYLYYNFNAGYSFGIISKNWLPYYLHEANYTNYTVTKTGGGASGTWNISVSGSAYTLSSWSQGGGGGDRYVWMSHSDNTAKVAYNSDLLINLTTHTLKTPNLATTTSITCANSNGSTNIYPGYIDIRKTTNNVMNYTTSNPRVIFSENGSQAVGLVYTDYDSYRASKGLKVMDVDNDDPSNVWFEVQGCLYVGQNAYSYSDMKLKYDIRDVLNKDVIDLFNTDNGFIRHFKWKDSNKDSYGVIAQEIQEYCPEAIDYSADILHVNYNIIYGKIIGSMFKRMKMQEQTIQLQNNDINELRKELLKLKQILINKGG